MENKAPQQDPKDPEMTALVERAKNNRNTIIMLCILVVLIVFGLVMYFYISNSGNAESAELAGRADIERNDSIAMELYKQAAEKGYKNGNRAGAMVAITLYNEGCQAKAEGDSVAAKEKWEEALEYLKDTSIDDKVVAAGVYSLTGDCYVNLKDYAAAVKAYDKAISKADKNPAVVPMLLFKKATVLEQEKDYDGEYEALKTIIEKYPQYVNSNPMIDVRKYYERAKMLAGK